MEYFEPFVPSFKFGKKIHRYDCPRASLGVPVARFDGLHDLIYQIWKSSKALAPHGFGQFGEPLLEDIVPAWSQALTKHSRLW
jgi:hypothetical protein